MKPYMPIILIAAGIIAGIALLISYVKSGKPLSAFVRHCAGGIGSLALINIFSGISGVSLPLNFFSLAASSLLGIPGTASLLICNIIFS